MGIFASIYDAQNGRDPLSVWPADVRQVLVINADGPFHREDASVPAVMIVAGAGRPGIARAVPVDADDKPMPGVMKGYSFIAASDARFGELVERVIGAPFYGAVALHDRREP